MEMMVVLLIMAIIAAATAPIVSKKMMASKSITSLIMAIIAAATAPIVSKKMMASKSNVSPWVFTGEGKNIAYNMGGLSNAVAIIGASKVPSGTKTRLYIDCGDDTAQIALGKGDTAASILADPVGKRVGIFSAASNMNVPNGTVALGMGQDISVSDAVVIGKDAKASGPYGGAVVLGNGANTSTSRGIAIGTLASTSGDWDNVAIGAECTAAGGYSFASGYKAHAKSSYAIAMGQGTECEGQASVAIGHLANVKADYATAVGHGAKATRKDSAAYGNATADGEGSVAIGYGASTDTSKSIAIGYKASNTEYGNAVAIGSECTANGSQSTAIGYRAHVLSTYSHSTALGADAAVTRSNQIVLGTKDDTVYIPGNLVVEGKVYIKSRNEDGSYTGDGGTYLHMIHDGKRGGEWGLRLNASRYIYPSDKRLKNIGDKFTAGVNELKKLDLYHFTFKKDESKTPHVGVIAQDLQKVFPDAVTKGEDGYLRIRFEDMFFAMINAIKELDARISALTEQAKSFAEDMQSVKSKNDEQDKIIETQGKTITELLKQNEELIKRIEQLEKQN